GGVVLLACGMALLWGFVQYKRQATESVERQSQIGLSWLRSQLQTEIGSATNEPTPQMVHTSLRRITNAEPEASAVTYYIEPGGEVFPVGGGPMGAPKIPWYVKAQIREGRDTLIPIHAADLTGRATQLTLLWRGETYRLGAIAVFYPDYRGRGATM